MVSKCGIKEVLAVASLLIIGVADSQAQVFFGPIYGCRYGYAPPRYEPKPSDFGYPLDEFGAGYYGGGRYREYYAYGRGYGFASFPGPILGPGVPPDYRPMWRQYMAAPAPIDAEIVPPPQVTNAPAQLKVQTPADAFVWLDGKKTEQTGTIRTFQSPPLTAGAAYTYEIKARWREQGRDVEQIQTVLVRPGAQIDVTFPAFPERLTRNTPAPFPLADQSRK